MPVQCKSTHEQEVASLAIYRFAAFSTYPLDYHLLVAVVRGKICAVSINVDIFREVARNPGSVFNRDLATIGAVRFLWVPPFWPQ